MHGLHLIAELYECRCDPQLLVDSRLLRELCLAVCSTPGLTPVGAVFHQFGSTLEPGGATGAVVLAESHLAVHTWPEYNFAAVTFETCGNGMDHPKAYNYLVKFFGAKSPKITHQKRGFMESLTKENYYKQQAG